MSGESIHALVARVSEDPDLQARFKAVGDEAAFNALTAELGFSVSFADFAGDVDDRELSEAELAGAAGGSFIDDWARQVENDFDDLGRVLGSW